ncbi:MAG: hypothetical protein LBD16_05235 [Oscillospiraceae bacterium]|jgi:hypothetical protein|nr:hypothetical protein [Oscillospiraceae bacterium]
MRKSGSRLLIIAAALVMLMTAASSPAIAADNANAPRGYFLSPEDLGQLPDNTSLPNLFEFFDKSADPNGNGYVDSPDEWQARSDELRDLLYYYIYGYKEPTPKEYSRVKAATQNQQVNWADGVMGAMMYGMYTELPHLPEGSYTYSLAWGSFYSNIAADESFVAAEAYEMPGDLADWKVGDTWAEHANLYEAILLPTWTVTIEVTADGQWLPETTGEFTVSLRAPSAEDTEYEAPYPILIATSALSEEQQVTTNLAGYAFMVTPLDGIPEAEYRKIYPETEDWTTDTGTKILCSWSLSRALDAFSNYTGDNAQIKSVDTENTAITGCSTGGKSALIGGIFEPRVKIISASDPGGGGLSGFRYSTESQLFSYNPPTQAGVPHEYAYGLNETIQRAIQNSGEAQWFDDRAQIFTTNPDLVDNTPIDLHALVALCATDGRYFICWTGEGQDAWLNSPATVLNILAGREVYEYLGYGDRIATIARDQAHANQDRDLPDIIAIMDKAFRGAEKYVVKSWDSLKVSAENPAAIDGSGTILPEHSYDSLTEADRNPYFIPSALLNWSRPDKYFIYTDANSVTEGIAIDITFYTDAESVTVTLADGTEKTVAAEDGKATVSITSEEAKAGQYTASATGSAKDSKTIEIRGWTVSDALRHGFSDNSALGHDVGTSVGFTTPLVNYNSSTDPVTLYLNGVQLKSDVYDYDNKVYEGGEVYTQEGYLQPYGATLIIYQGTPGDAVAYGEKVKFSIKNAHIEALIDYTIYIDVEFEKWQPTGTDGADGSDRARFKSTVQIPVVAEDGTITFTQNTQTPSWKPQQLQNTPKSGLPLGETRWPLLGNWASDLNEDGTYKPLDEIRPEYSEPALTLYDAVITAADVSENGAAISFSKAVNPNEFGIAIKGAKIASYEWSSDNTSVQITYAQTAEGEVSAIVFRSADTEGNLIGGPVELDLTPAK